MFLYICLFPRPALNSPSPWYSESGSFQSSSGVVSRIFNQTCLTTYAPFCYPVNPDNACTIRMPAAAGTYLAVLLSQYRHYLPADRALHTEILHHTRRRCIRVPIVQYSPLLPPVGVWAVSPSQCGRSPLRPATDRCLGGPLPRQLANQTRVHLIPPGFHCIMRCCAYAVLAAVSNCYLFPVEGGYPRVTHVRHSIGSVQARSSLRSTCMFKHAASVHPEPGSNSSLKFVPGFRYDVWSLSIPFTVLGLYQTCVCYVLFEILYLEFQGCHVVNFSRFFVFRLYQ